MEDFATLVHDEIVTFNDDLTAPIVEDRVTEVGHKLTLVGNRELSVPGVYVTLRRPNLEKAGAVDSNVSRVVCLAQMALVEVDKGTGNPVFSPGRMRT